MPIASRPRQQPRGPQSRYDLAGAHEPPNGRWLPPRNSNAFAAVAVPDPSPDRDGPRTERITATVNRRVDILEWEYSHRQIDEAAYQAGRTLKRAYERLPTAPAGSNWRGGDRLDPIEARNAKEDRHLDAMQAVERLEGLAAKVVGWSGVGMIRLVLRDGLTFGEIATRAQSKGGRATPSRVADRFRWLLAEIAEGWAAKGQDR